jgi:hypothetical protein
VRPSDQLLSGLRHAEQQLAELRQQLATLRRQIAQAEQPPTSSPDVQQLAQLNQQQQALQREIEQLSGELDRLQAADAAQSARNAANRLAEQSSADEQQGDQSQRPSSSEEVQRAEQDLEQAAHELAQRRQKGENELALEFVRRFQAELSKMLERQQRVIEETIALDAERSANGELSPTAVQAVNELASEEQQLAEMAHDQSKLLSGLGAVRISLEEAERRLAAAARYLEGQQTGPAAQQAEQRALARLEDMLQAFAQTASDAAANQPTAAGTGAPAGQPPPQRRPTFELLEVKMLRMLQVDLNERTRSHEQRVADAQGQLGGQQHEELVREARELQAEQARLSELVHQMLARNNDSEE